MLHFRLIDHSNTLTFAVPFAIEQLFTLHDGKHNATLTDIYAPVAHEKTKFVFVKTENVVTVYRKGEPKNAIWQVTFNDDVVTLNDVKYFNKDDSVLRFALNSWLKKHGFVEIKAKDKRS